MAGATETRRSPPFPTEDGALALGLKCSRPLAKRGDGIDATRLLPDDAAEIVVEATIDWDNLRASTGISAPCRIVSQNRCATTRWSSVSFDESRSGELTGTERLEWTISIPRSAVFGSVDCDIAILLAGDGDHTDGLAHREGSVLCRQSFQVRIDEGGFEFPTRWTSFAALGYPPGALWTLRIHGEDWTGLPEEVVVVQLNEDYSEFKRLLDFPNARERKMSDMLRQLIVCDTISEMVVRFLRSGFDEIDVHGQRLCDLVARMIERRFPADLDSLRDMAATDPARIRMQTQEVVRLSESLG